VKSAGNDIVALSAIDIRRTITPAFYLKIISVSEQELYNNLEALSFQNFIWLLWSVKESVYKYLQRINPGLIFSPTKIIVQNMAVPPNSSLQALTNNVWESDNTDEGFYAGEVFYGGERLYFRSKINTEMIATAVNHTAGFENVYWGIKSIGAADRDRQSKQVREFVLKKLMPVLAIEDLRIEKTPAGCPVLMKDRQQLTIPVSLAHHGYFIAYSFLVS
jgi:phosphopantetheinyl transferase (holo-ACP synthase)